MKKAPKKFIGFWVVIILSLILFFLFRETNQNQITIIASGNNFHVDFDLEDSEKKNLSTFTQKLGLPKTVTEELSFELDKVSSVALTLISPIKLFPNIEPDSISLTGKTSHTLFNKGSSLQKINVPKEYNLIIYSPNNLDFALSKVQFSEKTAQWLKENFIAQNGQYLIIFGHEAEFALIDASVGENIALDELAALDIDPNNQEEYKKETRDNIVFHFININNGEGNIETVTLFQLEKYTVLTSSREASIRLVDAFNSKESIEFPSFGDYSDPDLIVSFSNGEGSEISEEFVSLISEDIPIANPKIFQFLQKIEKFDLALNDTDFSGLINLK